MVMFCWGKNIKEVILAAIDTSTNIIIAQGLASSSQDAMMQQRPTTMIELSTIYIWCNERG